MRDAMPAETQSLSVRLARSICESECASRNALRVTAPGFALRQGDSGIVLETFDGGSAYLVEFGSRDAACDWMGVLYAREIELVSDLAQAA